MIYKLHFTYQAYILVRVTILFTFAYTSTALQKADILHTHS